MANRCLSQHGDPTNTVYHWVLLRLAWLSKNMNNGPSEALQIVVHFEPLEMLKSWKNNWRRDVL